MRAVLSFVFVLLMLASPSAHAQPSPDHAAELKQHGDELLHASKFKDAIAAYDEAYKLAPNPAILYNRARALEGLGEYAGALNTLEQFAREASPELKARVPKLDALMAEERAHVAMLAVTSTVSGATIVVQEKDVGSIPLGAPLRTNAGPTVLEVRAPGYQTFHVSMDLPGGTLTTIDAPLLKVGEKPPPPSARPSPLGGRKIVSIALGGVGVVLAGAAGVLFAMREGDVRTLNAACPNGICPTARTQELTGVRNRALAEGPIAAGLLIGAAVAVGVAVVVWAWPRGASRARSALVVRGATLSLEGSF